MQEDLQDNSINDNKETEFDKLFKQVKDTYEGKTTPSLDIGFPKLERYVSLRKSMYYLLGSYTGAGKSSIIDDMFILNPYAHYDQYKNMMNTKFKVIYFSMERNKSFKLLKWTIRKIFLDTGKIFEIGSLLGWRGYPPLNKQELNLFAGYKSYIDNMINSGIVEIHDGPINPMGIKKYVEDYALSVGKMVKVNPHQSIYIPTDPNQITLIIKDHVALYKKEKRDGIAYSSKKEIIDLASGDDRKFRDVYGFSIVNISQFNRDIADQQRLKGDPSPRLEDFKDSGSTQEDADVVMSIFDPWRYKVADPCGYDLNKLIDTNGSKYYRMLSVLKNSYGSDGISLGLAFQGAVGHFKEMPRRDLITDLDYQNIISGKYFKI